MIPVDFPGGIDITPGTNSEPVATDGFRLVTISGVPYYTTDGVTFTAVASPASGAVPLSSLAHQADQTVVGNVSGGSASPVALNKAQLTALVNPATASLPGAMPASFVGAGLAGASAFLSLYGPVIDIVNTAPATYVLIPPQAARYVHSSIQFEIKTTGGTISVAPTFSLGTNSASFDNQCPSLTIAAFKTQAAETIVGQTVFISPMPASDLTTSGLVLNITALATGAAPVLTVRPIVQFFLLPV